MILQVINSLNIGGAEKYVIELCKEFHRTGNRVDVLIFDRCETTFTEILKQNNVTIRYTASPKYLSPLNLFTFLGVMWSGKYSVIHTHLTYAQLWVAIASIFNVRGKKLFATEHSGSNNRRGRKSLLWVDKFLYSRYRKVFCISQTTKDKLIAWIRPRKENKYIVVPNCVNIDAFKNATTANRESIGLEQLDVVMIMTGRMCAEKDQPTLIRAVELLDDKYKCLLVGDGETMTEVKNCSTQPNKTTFTGTRSDIAALLKTSDIYVQSSHIEGLPTTILEAMAAEVPVFGSNVIGIEDILPKEQLFEHQNPTALAKMIKSLTDSRRAQIIKVQNKIVSNYSVKKIAADVLAKYRQKR